MDVENFFDERKDWIITSDGLHENNISLRHLNREISYQL